MLAYVAPDAEPPYELSAAQLERLDGLLVLVTAQHGHAVVRATVDGIHPQLHEVEITKHLSRLGCPSVAQLPTWAATPRVLTPSDLDLITYLLGIVYPRVRLEKPMDLKRRHELLAAVYADPHSDAPRLVYADFLLDHGDPHGELIARQLAGAPADELVAKHGEALAAPVSRWLRPGYAFRRGFLAECQVYIPPPREIFKSPVWSTVERLETTVDDLEDFGVFVEWRSGFQASTMHALVVHAAGIRMELDRATNTIRVELGHVNRIDAVSAIAALGSGCARVILPRDVDELTASLCGRVFATVEMM